MRPKVLIVNPFIEDFKLYDEWMHPLGLYALSSLLAHNGWHIDVIDCLQRDMRHASRRYATAAFVNEPIEKPLLYRDIPRRYKRYGTSLTQFRDELNRLTGTPDIICIGSCMTYWIGGLITTAQMLHDRFPDTPVVIGGISALLMPHHLANRVPFATIAHIRLLDQPEEIRGIHPLFATVRTAQWKFNIYEAMSAWPTRAHAPLLFSVGCPLRCEYCASALLQPRYYRRPSRIIIDEVRMLARKGVMDYSIYDDALLYRCEPQLVQLLHEWIDQVPPVRLHAPNGLHARWLTREIGSLLVRAGLRTIRLGYESGAETFKKTTAAKVSREELARALEVLGACGVRNRDTGVYVMAGLPGQRPEQVLEEFDFIHSLGVLVKPVTISPVPGTSTFKQYAEHYPQIMEDPLWHNDTFFITRLPGWSWHIYDSLTSVAKQLNSRLEEPDRGPQPDAGDCQPDQHGRPSAWPAAPCHESQDRSS